MEWVDGLNLNYFIEDNLGQPGAMNRMADRFCTLIENLKSNGIAHGDLQHGNILIVDGDYKLVDYDGMYVSALRGFGSNELGHRNYQHPARTRDDFGDYLDNFSAWV